MVGISAAGQGIKVFALKFASGSRNNLENSSPVVDSYCRGGNQKTNRKKDTECLYC